MLHYFQASRRAASCATMLCRPVKPAGAGRGENVRRCPPLVFPSGSGNDWFSSSLSTSPYDSRMRGNGIALTGRFTNQFNIMQKSSKSNTESFILKNQRQSQTFQSQRYHVGFNLFKAGYQRSIVIDRNDFSSTSTLCGDGLSGNDLKKEIDNLTDQFMETRELLADAMEAKGTVYFNEDLEEAKESVQETLERYKELLERLDEEQERTVRRTIGLKMEELRAQEAFIEESLKED